MEFNSRHEELFKETGICHFDNFFTEPLVSEMKIVKNCKINLSDDSNLAYLPLKKTKYEAATNYLAYKM